MRNKFKGLDLIDRVPDVLWAEVLTLYRRQGSRPSLRKRKSKKQNGCLTEEALQQAVKKRSEKQRRKGKIYPFEYRLPKNSKER